MQQHLLYAHILHGGSTLLLASLLATVLVRGDAMLTQANFITKVEEEQ